MKIEAQNLINYHCPRWNELPEIELYIDQVICVLQNNLAIFLKEENTPVITPNMINNYVKQEVLMPPIKKKYNKAGFGGAECHGAVSGLYKERRVERDIPDMARAGHPRQRVRTNVLCAQPCIHRMVPRARLRF